MMNINFNQNTYTDSQTFFCFALFQLSIESEIGFLLIMKDEIRESSFVQQKRQIYDNNKKDKYKYMADVW